MTRQKSFKRRVRARMDKTGESYTAARRQLIDTAADDESAAGHTSRGQQQRMSGDAMRERSGRDWDEWFALLDEWYAQTRTHSEIARWLVEQHGVDGWSAQSITVAYEQARGMREPGQDSSGVFVANASKTIATSATRATAAFIVPALRERWLPGVDLEIRTATAGKSVRANYDGDRSRVNVYFVAKGAAKCQVAVSHERLAGSEEVANQKAYWRDRLGVLKDLLEHEQPG